jgi:hypothetical protein
MVIETLKAARDFIENDRQALAESLTVNGEIVFEDDIDRRAMAEYVNVLVVIDEALKVAARPDDHCEERLDMVKERPAPAQPACPLKEVDVLMMAEAHGIDPSTKGLYGFYIDCISNQPAAQPAVPLTQKQVVDGFCKTPHQTQYVAVFDAGVRFAEAAHGITKGQP